MSERIRSILAVVVLTIAVWVWADLEQTGESEDRIPVQVNVPPDFVVRAKTPDHLTVRIRGPIGEIQDLKASPDEMGCRFDLTEPELKGGRAVLHARDGFRHWRSRRVVVTGIKDDQGRDESGDITVVLDRRVRVTARVEPKITGAIASEVRARPAEVSALVAESDLKALPQTAHYVLAPLAVTSIPANPEIEREVPLDRRLGGPEGIEAQFDPATVKVTARVEFAVTTRSLGRFPILVSASPEMLNRYRIVFQPQAERWVELEVQGPAPDVERLNVQDIRVQLILTPDDKPDPDSWLPGKPVVAGLPPSVKLVKPLPTVNFNLEKINDKPPTP